MGRENEESNSLPSRIFLLAFFIIINKEAENGI
jgi:hypothetical protein